MSGDLRQNKYGAEAFVDRMRLLSSRWLPAFRRASLQNVARHIAHAVDAIRHRGRGGARPVPRSADSRRTGSQPGWTLAQDERRIADPTTQNCSRMKPTASAKESSEVRRLGVADPL